MLCKKGEAICRFVQGVWYLQVSYTTHKDVCHAQYQCLIEDALVQTRTNLDHVHRWNHKFDYHEMLILSPAFDASSWVYSASANLLYQFDNYCAHLFATGTQIPIHSIIHILKLITALPV